MQKYLNSNDVIGDIKLSLKHPATKNKIWILVEGDTDFRLFIKLLQKENKVEVKQSYGGVTNLLIAVETLIKETNRVIGIRDADFMRLKKEKVPTNIFLTDFHDVEMMIIFSDESFKSIIAEYFSEKLNFFTELREEILTNLRYISIIKLHNDINNLEFNFKGSNISNFYDININKLDEDKYIEHINQKSPNKREILIRVS